MFRAVVSALMLLALGLPAQSLAQQKSFLGRKKAPNMFIGPKEMFGPAEGDPYVAPGRLFQVVVPQDWEAKTFKDKPDYVEFRVSRPYGSGLWQIKRVPVLDGARAKQLLVRALEKRLKKMPHFEELSRRDVTINGVKAASVMGSYWFQGNAQFPRAIEEVFLVLGKEAFEMHFECFEPMAERIAEEMNRTYQSFVPRPPGEGTLPAPSDDDEDDSMNLDNIPF